MTCPPSKQHNKLYPHQYTIYLDDEDDAAVRRYAADNRMTIAASLRELLSYGVDSLNQEGD